MLRKFSDRKSIYEIYEILQIIEQRCSLKMCWIMKKNVFFLNVLNNKRKIVLNHTVKGYLSRMHWIVEKSVHKIFDIGMSVKKKCSLNVDKS